MGRVFVDLSIENGGLGDIITLIPTIRLLKKKNPNSELIVVTYFQNIDVFAYCDYVDYIIPSDIITEDWKTCANVTHEDKVFALTHSFLAQHKHHIVISPISEIARSDHEGVPLEYELSVRNFDLPIIEKHKQKLLDLAQGKKIVGLGPAITMYSRMYPQTHWQELTNILRKNNYFVVSLGHKDDLKLDVDFDARGAYPIRHVPKILDVFEAVFVVNSGMMHLAGINPKVHLVVLSVGQFPASLFIPFRNGNTWADNSTVIEHNCPLVQKCFLEHINEIGINEQYHSFVNKWEQESGKEFPPEEGHLALKYTCWKYCGKPNNKYSCSNIPAQVVFDAFQKRQSILRPVPDKAMPSLHGEHKTAVEDYQCWKEVVLLQSSRPNLFVNILDAEGDLLEKMRCAKVLFPKYTIVVIGRKKHVEFFKECEYVHSVLPIELISRSLRFKKDDIMLKL